MMPLPMVLRRMMQESRRPPSPVEPTPRVLEPSPGLNSVRSTPPVLPDMKRLREKPQAFSKCSSISWMPATPLYSFTASLKAARICGAAGSA